MEWPPHSGRMQEFPEIDRVAWFSLGEARVKIKARQAAFLERLEGTVAESGRHVGSRER
jgi:predicted NUDIX family NTP pyrophosphohydrolase